MAKRLILILNMLLALFGIAALYLSSNIWLGSKEDLEEAINVGTTEFVLTRFIFNGLVILALLVLHFLMTKFSVMVSQTTDMKTLNIKKTILRILMLYLIISFAFILLSVI